MNPRPRGGVLYGALAVGVAVLVYVPILRNYFFLDDFLTLHQLRNWPLAKFLTVHWAGHRVVIRQAFFAALYALAGGDPRPYYAIVLALHAMNVALVFALVRTVTECPPLACLAAAMWGTSPLHEGTLGWLAASGNVFVGTTTLVVTHGAVVAAWRDRRVGPVRAAGWTALLLAGAQSFGTGLGIAIAAPLVLTWLLWDRMTRTARAVVLGVPVLTAVMYGADYSEFTGRLGSSLFAKMNLLLHLHVIGLLGLLEGLGYEPGPIDFSAPVRADPSTFPGLSWIAYVTAAVVLASWAAAVIGPSGNVRRLLVGLGILVLADYGVVAVGRAFFLELFHQPVVGWASQGRYHYSATALVAIGCALVSAQMWRASPRVWPRVALILWLALSAVLYARSGWTISHYDAERDRAERILARIDAAIAMTPPEEPVITYNEPFSDGPFIHGAASLYVIMRPQATREVYFVDRGAAAIFHEVPGSPLAQVILPPPAMSLACGPRAALQSETD